MQKYILYKSYMKPIKGQLPDIIYRYVDDDAHFPYDFRLTNNKWDARIFEDIEEARHYAYLFDFDVKEL